MIKSSIKELLRRISLSIILGYITYFYSEIAFWANPARLPDVFETVLYYSFTSYLLLWMISYFRLNGKYKIFLAGSIFGWIIEGILVFTVYEAIPFSIIWTGMAWHGLITILLGFYAADKILRKSFIQSSLFFSAIGLFLGFWATFWWMAEEETFVLTTLDYAQLMITITVPLIVAYYLFDRLKTEFIPGKVEGRVVLSIFVLYVILISISLLGLPLIIILPSFIIMFLFKNKMGEVSYLMQNNGSISIINYLSIFTIPIFAVLYYYIALTLSFKIEVSVIVALTSVFISLVMFFVGIIKINRSYY